MSNHLVALYGAEYSESWLASKLKCSPETAAELAGYVLPTGFAHLFERALRVFANALDLDQQSLAALLVPGPSEQMPGSSHYSPPAPKKQAAAAAVKPRVTEISIGSAEGVRVTTLRQPTIVYRKTRTLVPTA